jgi:hypothetical protein
VGIAVRQRGAVAVPVPAARRPADAVAPAMSALADIARAVRREARACRS